MNPLYNLLNKILDETPEDQVNLLASSIGLPSDFRSQVHLLKDSTLTLEDVSSSEVPSVKKTRRSRKKSSRPGSV